MSGIGQMYTPLPNIKTLGFTCNSYHQADLSAHHGEDVTDTYAHSNDVTDSYHLTTLQSTYADHDNQHDFSFSKIHESGDGDVPFHDQENSEETMLDAGNRYVQDPLNAAMTTCGLTTASPSGPSMSSQPEGTSPSTSFTSVTSESTQDIRSANDGVPYDNVMVWLNQQSCGGTVKRKRRINRRQRLAANQRERRRMVSMNSAFEELRKTIPTLPFEKKLSRIQTLKLAMDYMTVMSDILSATAPPTTGTSGEIRISHAQRELQGHSLQRNATNNIEYW